MTSDWSSEFWAGEKMVPVHGANSSVLWPGERKLMTLLEFVKKYWTINDYRPDP